MSHSGNLSHVLCAYPIFVLTALFVLISQFSCVVLKAQLNRHDQQQFHNFILRDGLSQGTVRSIIQDRQGFIWIGTSNGLNRFDGFEFKTYAVDRFSTQSLNNQWVNELVEAPDGTIWIGTNGGGINRYHPETGHFSRIEDTTGNYLDDQRIISMYSSSDSIMWIGTFEGLARYNMNRDVFLETEIDDDLKALEKTLVHQFLEDQEGRLWIVSDEGLFLWDDKEEKVRIAKTNIEGEKGILARSLKQDQDGRFWLGTRNRGVFSFVVNSTLPELINLEPFELRDEMGSVHITDIVIDEENHVWIASARGVFYYSSASKHLHKYVKDQERASGFNDRMALSLYLDDFNNLWVGAQSTGLYLTDLQPNKFQLISQNDISEIHHDIWTMLEVDDRLLIGARQGIVEMEKSSTGYQKITAWADGDNITHLIRDQEEDIWAGVFGGGLARVNIKKQKLDYIRSSSQPLKNRRVLQIHAVSDSLIFVGTTGGVFEYHRMRNEFTRIRLSAGDQRMIYSFADNGKDLLWIGTDSGLFEYSLIDKTVISRQLKVPGQVNDIESEVNVISYHPGFHKIYAGTNHGLIVLDENLTARSANHFVGENLGLSDQLVLGMVLNADQSELWLSTSQTVYQVDLTKEGLVEQAKNIVEQTQFRANEFNAAAYELTTDGTVLFGGVHGVTYFNPMSWQQSEESYPVNIYKAEIESNEKNRNLRLDYNAEKSIEIKPEERSIEFMFIYPDMSLQADQMFYYTITSGKDGELWESIRGKRSIKFSNLQSGDHRFSISAYPPQYENRNTSTVTIKVLPHFWQTAWFQFIIIMLFLSGGFLVMRLREQRLKRQKKDLRSEINKQTHQLEETNEKLKQSEQLFRSITENVGDIVILATPNGLIRYCSPSLKQVLGYTSEEIIGTRVLDHIHPDEQHIVIDLTRQTFEQNRVLSDVYRLQHKNGEWRQFITTGSGIKAEGNRVSAIVTVSRDVTEQMKIQELTEQAKESAEAANRAKSNFLAGISHELRTPLNAILGYSRLLYEDETMPERQRSYAETMYKSGDHLLGMINEILDLSKIESGKMGIDSEVFSPTKFLEDIYSIFKLKTERKSIALELNIPDDLPEFVAGDVSKLRQIMINLIGNAVKFTEDGKITVYCGILAKMDEHITLQLGVRDTGIGIPDDQIDAIFEPFRQVEGRYNSGTGLGLALTRKLTELLSGNLHVESITGVGTDIRVEMTFRLSDEQEELTQKEQRLPVSLKSEKQPDILIIDDIDTNAHLIRDLLNPVGFSCRITSNGLDGLKEIYRKQPDIVLLDLRMPGMSGEEVLKELRENRKYKTLPVVAVTATGFLEKRKDMIDWGFNDLIFKPLNAERLFSVLEKELELTYVYRSEQRSRRGQNLDSDNLNLPLKDVDTLLKTMSENQQEQFKESCMLTDFDQLKKIVDQQPGDLPVVRTLRDIVENKNYKALLGLNDHFQK